MNFFDFLEEGVDISEAYMHFMIENYDLYMSVSFTKNSELKFRTFQSQKEMADSLILNLERRSNVYYFKKSDYEMFIRKGVDVHKHIQDSGRHKEVAKKLRERYRK